MEYFYSIQKQPFLLCTENVQAGGEWNFIIWIVTFSLVQSYKFCRETLTSWQKHYLCVLPTQCKSLFIIVEVFFCCLGRKVVTFMSCCIVCIWIFLKQRQRWKWSLIHSTGCLDLFSKCIRRFGLPLCPCEFSFVCLKTRHAECRGIWGKFDFHSGNYYFNSDRSNCLEVAFYFRVSTEVLNLKVIYYRP